MNKRALVIKRRMVNKALFGLVLAAIVLMEVLAMGQLMKATSRAPVKRQFTIDPGICLERW